MESVPLIPKAKALPSLDVAPLLRELFQDEFQAPVPSKKVSQNLLTSLQYEKTDGEDKETFRSVDFLENLAKRRDNVIEFAENVLEAYATHDKALEGIREAERSVFEAHAHYLKFEAAIADNEAIRDLLRLKREPLLKPLDGDHVKRYKLLQGDVGLPPKHEAKLDFRVKSFYESWKREEYPSEETLTKCSCKGQPARAPKKKQILPATRPRPRKPRPKKSDPREKKPEVFRVEPRIVFFTDYKLGEVYTGEVEIKNVHTRGLRFQLKPTCPDGPFRVIVSGKDTSKLFPGLSLRLIVEFAPKALDNAMEDVIVEIEDGTRLAVPLVAYLEPPVLKTHEEISEFTKSTSERIASSYIECGPCFTGDSKVTKLRFRCYRGSGEFFVMSSENWNRSSINSVTFDNILEIPPFQVYPVYFKMEKDEVIDLFVEFLPKHSGTHVENIMIACDNGEVRSLDLLADAVGWHSYFFSFQSSLAKDLPVDKDDDVRVKYYLDFEDVTPTGKVEKVFCVSNSSNMAFEFQWKIREANISTGADKYLRMSKYQVKIDPESGTFEANSVWEFLVTITFNDADVGDYRMVLSLYVLNLPYQCIEEDDTIIQPTGLVRNLYSQSLYGEEEFTASSPELMSLQGTYESLQESIKSYVEFQNKAQKTDFCRMVCIPNPGVCAKPLKKSKTYCNVGESADDEGFVCGCRMRPAEGESVSDSCTSNVREDKATDPPRNEVIWDFVDILVDEVELWVEVVHPRATLEPSVIKLGTPLRVGDASLVREVRITNHNRSPITCSWFDSPPEKTSSSEHVGKEELSVALLFDGKQACKSEWTSEEQTTETDDATPDAEGQPGCQGWRTCKVDVEPRKGFKVPGLSQTTCTLEISPGHPGRIRETLCLSVNEGDLLLKLLIVGTTVGEQCKITPEIIDFGVLRTGMRYVKDLRIVKESPGPLYWNINQFKFDIKGERFLGVSSAAEEQSIATRGVINDGAEAVEPYHLDARVPGVRCSLLEVQAQKFRSEAKTKQYVLVLGHVKLPQVCLSSPRFENAILAPPGMMYVGHRVSTRVTLKNQGSVETFFTWGNPFGCHSRKIKVEISPKHCRIDKKKKLSIDIDLIPLDEGIISHCYVPCFFCRSAEPLILSVVGIAENLNVTFEIIDYPGQVHADAATFLKSPYYHTVLRMPWPVKVYNPNLSLRHINEADVLTMNCQCSEVDEEANRAFGNPNPDSEPAESETSLQSFPSSEEINRRSGHSLAKSNLAPEDLALSGLSSLDKKRSEDNSVQKYSSGGSYLETLQCVKPHLEFLNVPFRTPQRRQFVIRNETPILTSFQISVLTFGVSKDLPNRRIERIKNRVMGHSKDEFEEKLTPKQPLVVVVEPSQGELPAHDAVRVDVYAYGDTWGEYRDQLLCHIKGIEPASLKVFVQIVGHPIFFPIFDAQKSLKPTLRFEPLSYTSRKSTKQIKVVNRSSIPLTVSWLVFLIQPLPQEEEQEELCADSNPNLESNYSGEVSSNSTKVYLPKNASESVTTLQNMIEAKGDFSQNSESFESFRKSESIKHEREGEAATLVPSLSEEGKLESQPFSFAGRLDTQIFQVDPKEMSFDPHEEKRMRITFNSDAQRLKSFSQEFKGVLTGCVKLQPEDERCPGVYYRPCGMNFVSELVDFDAAVETPLLSFEILRGDLKFIVDANAVIRAPQKEVKMTRKYLVKNNREKSVIMKIEVLPGVIFRVKSVDTLDKLYSKYNPDKHDLKIEPGQALEMELECSVTYKDVIYAFEQMKQKKNKELQALSPVDTKTSNPSENEEEPKKKKEPWQEYFGVAAPGDCNLYARDSLEINLNRMSSNSVSDNSICPQAYAPEFEGEYLEISLVEEPVKSKPPQRMTVVEEEISFVQKDLVTQSIMAELHLSFPALKLSPKCLDFGNVYLGEAAVRYCTVTNLTGFATDFRVKAKHGGGDFVASPLRGSVPATNYNSDIGRTITFEFKPSQPGYFKEVFQVFSNLDMEFDFQEIFVAGLGTWNEKYKRVKYENYTKLGGVYSWLRPG